MDKNVNLRNKSIYKVSVEEARWRTAFPVVHWLKDRPFFGSRVSHFLKIEPKISISEDKGTNRGHPHAQIMLANTVISASTYSPQAVSQMGEVGNKQEMEMQMNIFGTSHGIYGG